MKTFIVYETEYPDESGMTFQSWTAKGAYRKYRRAMGECRPRSSLIELDALEIYEVVAAQHTAPLNGELYTFTSRSA